MTEAVMVRDLTFRYPTREDPAFQAVSFAINEGDAVLLAGPSGCGKSTLALCLNGLIPHAVPGELHGDVRVYGTSTRDVAPCMLVRHVGMVFQDPESQFCMLTVEEELAFGLENLGFSPDEMKPRILEALALVGLEDERTTRLDRLSGGTKQKVALAAALAMGPHILVLDEPTANLDPVASASFFHTVARLRKRGHHTFIVIEHKLDSLVELADRMLVMDRNGAIRADASPRRVLQEEQEFLRDEGIWIPEVCELAIDLRAHGLPLPSLPLTVDEAVSTISMMPCGSRAAALDILVPRRPPGNPVPGEPPAVEVTGLSYRYPGGIDALHDASLRVEEGDFLAIVGPNGSGKTTLALHMVGVLRPPKAAVTLYGKDVSNWSPHDVARVAGYVFQNPEHQFVTDHVVDELRYGPRRMRWPRDKIEEAVERVLSELDLLHLAEEHPFNLSQGQKRRLSVASMALCSPRLLVLDEPTFGQDRSSAFALMDTLTNLNRVGTTIVVVTHDMRLVAEYARRVAVMMAGRVIWTGAPDKLFGEARLLTAARLRRPPRWELISALQEDQSGIADLTGVVVEDCP